MATDFTALRAELERHDRAMFPGEWEYVCAGSIEPHTIFGPLNCGSRTSVAHTPWDRPGEAENFQGIAAIRNALPAIIAALAEAEEMREERATIAHQFDDRPLSFLQLLKERARELQPDYPYKPDDDAFTWLWALTSGLEGTDMANKDLHAELGQLRARVGELEAGVQRAATNTWAWSTSQMHRELTALLSPASGEVIPEGAVARLGWCVYCGSACDRDAYCHAECKQSGEVKADPIDKLNETLKPYGLRAESCALDDDDYQD